MPYGKMYILGLGKNLGPGVDYGGVRGVHTSLYPRWPWMLGQKEPDVDGSKCFVGFKSFGVLGSNLGLTLQAVGAGLWGCQSLGVSVSLSTL